MTSFWSRPRSLYAAVFVWLSITGGRFLAPFLEHEAGLSGFQIGMLLSLYQLVSVASSFVSGSIGDAMESKYPGKGRALVLVVAVGMGSLLVLLHGVAHWVSSPVFETVYWYGLLRVFSAVSSSFVFPALDSICLEYLKQQPDRSPQEYGKERLFGAISWAVINGCLGFYLDVTAGDFALVIYPTTIASTLLVFATVFVYWRNCHNASVSSTGRFKKRSSNLEAAGEPPEENNKSGASSCTTTDTTVAAEQIPPSSLLRTICMSWFGLSFVVCTITLSSGQAVVEHLVFLFFEILGSTYTMMGLTVILTVAFEIPIFHIAPKLLHEWGAGVLLLVAAGCYITRVIGYTLIPEGKVALVLLLEPLHGVTFACATTAGVEVLSRLTPRGSEATAQSLLQLFVGAGSVMGLLFGGWATEALGQRIMYRMAALVVLLGSVVFGSVLFRCGEATSTPASTHEPVPHDDVELTDLTKNTDHEDS
jgi:MFS family permease